MSLYSMSVRHVGGGQPGARASASDWVAYCQREREYGNKDGFILSHVLLPKFAPPELREAWQASPRAFASALDDAERQADGQSGREFMLALQHDLTVEQNLRVIGAWLEPMLAEGMCAYVAVHTNENGGNLHAHVLASTRALDERGEWGKKRETAYPVRRGKEEMAVTAAEWKAAKAEGWEKIYAYKNGANLTQSEARAAGLNPTKDRRRKQPLEVSRKTTKWDDRETIREWRERWAQCVNEALERHAPEAERVDHRSYADRGVDQVPQVHVGAQQWAAEERGAATVKGEKNRQIAALNEALGEPEVPAALKQAVLEEGYEIREKSDFRDAAEVRRHPEGLLSRIADCVREAARGAREAVSRAASRLFQVPAPTAADVERRRAVQEAAERRRDALAYLRSIGGPVRGPEPRSIADREAEAFAACAAQAANASHRHRGGHSI